MRGKIPRLRINLTTSTQKYNALQNNGGVCMAGSIHFRKDTGWWFVLWYDKKSKGGVKVCWYKSERMYRKQIARKLLSLMQSEVENGTFRLENYLTRGTPVNPYFEKWLKTKEKKSPATVKGYRSYYNNWIKPFFKKNHVQLHEIKLDILDELLDSIKLSGKGKLNVMMCFHSFLDYAWRSDRIPRVPPFPKKEDYGIQEPTIRWLPETRQMAIINAIPEVHKPVFLWLKYHLRRIAEACALHKSDYDPFTNTFTIKRSVSARKVTNTTKTHREHVTPCHSEFTEIARKTIKTPGKYFFTNPKARKDGKRYTNESLNNIWKKACKKVGEDIDLYSGLKHSSCSQYINEKGMSESDLQLITDHARLDSVRKYVKTEVARKRELMEYVPNMSQVRKRGNKT